MISVPCGTGDIADAMISASQMIYTMAYEGTDIISYFAWQNISCGVNRISYRASDISLNSTTNCDRIVVKEGVFIYLKQGGEKMIYGVKVVHTHTVGEDDQRYYEELILRVDAESFDEAYEKAENYMHGYVCEYTNIYGKIVKTINIEAVDCFLAYEPDGDVQELYSSFSINDSSLSEEEYYKIITSPCGEKELRALRNKDFN